MSTRIPKSGVDGTFIKRFYWTQVLPTGIIMPAHKMGCRSRARIFSVLYV